MQANLLRSFDLAVHDSGGRYPLALELAPDLPRDLLRYDSRKDPYRDVYRDRRKESSKNSDGNASDNNNKNEKEREEVLLRTASHASPAASGPQERLGIKGKLARGIQSLFSAEERVAHIRTRSEEVVVQAQATRASQAITHQSPLPLPQQQQRGPSPIQLAQAQAQAPTSTSLPRPVSFPPPAPPSSIWSPPPPLPPKPFPLEHPHPHPTHPPVPPAPLRPRGQTVDSDKSPNWAWDNTKNTADDMFAPASEPTIAMSRLQQWTQTLKGQHFEDEEGMHGPYETGSVVGMVPPSPTILSDMKKKDRSERSARTRSGETTPKSRKSKTPKHDSGDLTLHEAKEKRSSKHSQPESYQSERYSNADAARAAAIAKLEAKTTDVDRMSKASKEQKHSRHHTLDTDLTQSTASFGHLLHQNGQPLRVNMQTHPGLLPRGGVPPGHRRNNSNGTPLGDIREVSEPRSMVMPPGAASPTKSSRAPSTKPPSPVPMTGEAASYYYPQASPAVPSVPSQYRAQVETIPDPQDDYRMGSITPTRQDSGDSSAHHARPSSGVLPESRHSPPAPHRSPPVSRHSPPPSASRHMSSHLSRAFSAAEAEIAHSLNMLNLDPSSPTPQSGVPQVLTHDAARGQSAPATPSYHPATGLQSPFNPQAQVQLQTPPQHAPKTPSAYQPSIAVGPPPRHSPSESASSHAHSSVRPDSPSTIRSLSYTALPKVQSPSGQSVVSLPSTVTAPSIATAMVPQMVQRSTFHDETLCQLLDASRLNLLGEEAKKALMRAARARVVELKDIREKTKELEKEVTRTEPLVIKKKKHKKRSGKHDSDSDTEAVARKDKVEVLLESLLEKQEVDQATKEHVCKDPANHSRCLSPDGEIEKVEEDLYRGRISSGTYSPSGPPGPPGQHGPMYTPGSYPGYQFPFPPQPYPVYVQPMPQIIQQVPMQPLQSHPVQRGLDPASEDDSPNLNHRPGFISRDSQDLMAEVLNVEYAGIPVKQILQEFLERQEGIKPGSIHSIPTTPERHNESRERGPPSPISPKTPSPRVPSPHVFSNAPSVPQSPRTPNLPRVASAASVPSSHHSHKQPPSLQRSPHKSAPPSAPSVRSTAPSHPATAQRAPESATGKDSDWAWGSEIKIRVQPPTTLSNTPTKSNSKAGSAREVARAAPTAPSTVPPTAPSVAPSVAPTVRSNIDYTASYLFDRELPPLPPSTPSTYVPSVAETIMLPSDVSTASNPHRMAPPFKGTPWELVAHRLYSWALVWEDDYFSRALESISIGRPVDEFPLTVVSMMIFKRILQLRMTNTPPQPCDKLFVPPNIAEAINKAVHAKQYADAQALLEGLWYAFGLTEPPRVIISLVRHGAVHSAWIANRYDLVTHRFATYIVCNNMPREQEWDGRPFMWWHPIRNAWPGYNIPDPIALTQVIKPITVPVEFTEDISLRAASIARNLLLGIRPEHDHDIPKLRKQTWTEVNRLHTKKRAGRLMVHTSA